MMSMALILSRFTGACHELTDALLINPYDTGEMPSHPPCARDAAAGATGTYAPLADGGAREEYLPMGWQPDRRTVRGANRGRRAAATGYR
jgi:hypothetical protein